MIPRFSLHKLKDAIERQRAELKLSNRRYAVAERFKEAQERKEPNKPEAEFTLQYFYEDEGDRGKPIGTPFAFNPSQESIVTAAKKRGNSFWKENAVKIEDSGLMSQIEHNELNHYTTSIEVEIDDNPVGYEGKLVYITFSWNLPRKLIRIKTIDENDEEVEVDSFYYERRDDAYKFWVKNNSSIMADISSEDAEFLDRIIFLGMTQGSYNEDLDTVDFGILDDDDVMKFYAITPMIVS